MTPWLAAALFAAAACSSAERGTASATTGREPATTAGGSTSSAVQAPSTTAPVEAPPPPLSFQQVADLGTAITAMTTRAGQDDTYVAEREGRVRSMRPAGEGFERGGLVLDISRRVVDADGERGLLGLAFSPDGSELFVSYTDGNDDGASVVERYRMNGDRADPASRVEVLRLAQPFANHNGGDIVVGPDRMLYIGFGDGGGQGDPRNNAQNRQSLLGKILRLDVLDPPPGRPYGIPADNPFAGGGGRGEIWSVGLRNPWRFSFDPANGDLWIGDVGGDSREEIDRAPAEGGQPGGRGLNFGWPLTEGTQDTDRRGDRSGFTAPVLDYPHEDGACSVTGGLVVRSNSRVPGLDGTYLFADYCTGVVEGFRAGAEDPEPADLGRLPDGARPVSFAGDTNGDAYVLALDGRIFRAVRR